MCKYVELLCRFPNNSILETAETAAARMSVFVRALWQSWRVGVVVFRAWFVW